MRINCLVANISPITYYLLPITYYLSQLKEYMPESIYIRPVSLTLEQFIETPNTSIVLHLNWNDYMLITQYVDSYDFPSYLGLEGQKWLAMFILAAENRLA